MSSTKGKLYQTLKTTAARLNRAHLPYIGSTIAQLENQLKQFKTLQPLETKTRESKTRQTPSKSEIYGEINRFYKKYNIPARKDWKTKKAVLQRELTRLQNTKTRKKQLLAQLQKSQTRTVNYFVNVQTNKGIRPLDGSIILKHGQKPIDAILDEMDTRTSDYSMNLEEPINANDIKFNIVKSHVLSRPSSIRRVRRTPLNAVIYKINKPDVSKFQDKENCMLNYIVECANKRGGDNKLINGSHILDIVQKEASEGLSVEDTEKICERLKIKCLAIMKDGTLLSDVKASRSNGGLMFVVSNGHCYPIAENARRSFARKHRNTSVWTTDKKQDELEGKYTTDLLEDIISSSFEPYEERNEEKVEGKYQPVEPNKLFIDIPEFSKQKILDIMYNQKCLFSVKSHNKKITSLKIDNTIIKALPDEKNTMEFCDTLKIKKVGDSLASMSMKQFEKTYGKIPISYFNDETRKIIYSVNPTAINTRFSELKKSDKAVDIQKCYTAALIKKQVFPVFSNSDYPEKYKGFRTSRQGNKYLKPGKYYIETTDKLLLRGSGWYSHEITKYALRESIISNKDIKYELISQYYIDSSRFAQYVDFTYKEFSPSTAKKVVNFLIGSLGIKTEERESNYITNCKDEAISIIAKAPDTSTHSTYNGIHYITTKSSLKSSRSNCPIYQQIVEQGRISAYKLYKRVPHPVAIKTDCVIYRGFAKFSDKELEEGIGNLRFESLPSKVSFTMLDKYEPLTKITPTYLLKKWKWNTIQHNSPEFTDDIFYSYCLDGYAGTGKSWIINNKISDSYERLAFTNSACNNIKGRTLHGFLKMKLGDESINKTTFEAIKNKDLVIDEYSMIPEDIFNSLIQLKINGSESNIIFSGDSRQIQFIPRNSDNKELKLNKPIPRLGDTYTFAMLCGFNKIVLNHCHRADKKFAHDLININYKQHEGNFKEASVHITITNKKRESINEKEYSKASGKVIFEAKEKKSLEGKDFKYKRNTPWISKIRDTENKISKNEFFELIAYEKKNNVLVLKSEHGNKICIKPNKFQALFDMRYAMTVNKLQGKTLKENFIIHQWNHLHNDNYKKYTSLSRACRSGQFKIFY